MGISVNLEKIGLVKSSIKQKMLLLKYSNVRKINSIDTNSR